MNKGILLLTAFAFVALLTISFASAVTLPSCDPSATTIKGTIYQNNNLGDHSVGSNVTVICHTVSGDIAKNTTSDAQGSYAVVYTGLDSVYCTYGDNATVIAWNGPMTGMNDGNVSKNYQVGCLDLDVGIINVPLVPEFGLIAGLSTITAAIAAFFFIRRK